MRDEFDDLEEEIKPYKERDNSEYKIHVAIIAHLRGHTYKGNEVIKGTAPFRGLFVTHIYQGRSADEGFFLKRLGVVAGVPDLLAIWPDKVKGYDIGFLEVKSSLGTLSTPQRRFKGFCHSLGIKWGIARSVTEAHKQFIAWGLQPVHNGIREPDTRTTAQKKQDAFDMYRR